MIRVPPSKIAGRVFVSVIVTEYGVFRVLFIEAWSVTKGGENPRDQKCHQEPGTGAFS